MAGEPSIHVSKANLVGLGSENGVGGGSVYWRKTQTGGAGASACALTYSGQPNAVGGTGASGGDVDTAFAPVKDPRTNTYRIYVASLNLASINVATSTDNGKTFASVPVEGGVPVDDREWIAAYGAKTSLLTYHDIPSNNIDVLRSDTGGAPYTQISTAIPPTNYKASSNELGNIVIVETWSNDTDVFAAYSHNHGRTWSCTGNLTGSTQRAVFPWLVAGASGTDLVYYGTTDPAGPNQTWYVYFAQLTSSGVASTNRLVAVHKGQVCEGGAGCTGGRQLLDDFGVDTDQSGYAHVAYSHDAPALGGSGSYTGYVQTAGTRIGAPN